MANLKGSKTEDNLKAAFAGESQANRRYLYFAQKADVEGYNDVAAVFRSTAEGETGHAHGHLEFLEVSGDPATGLPIGPTGANLKAAIAGETHEYTDMYPGMARTAREEGFDEDRRLVRDAGQGREEPRRPLPEGARHDGLSLSGFAKGTRAGPLFRPTTAVNENGIDMREGSLEAPTRHALDWQNPWFWDEKALEAEMERVFDICHGCRRCFNLCDSFPRLFDLIDNGPTGEVDGVKKEDYAQVDEACTLCDMCFMTKCPYVPPHEWAVDFPHLMLRHRAVQARKNGIGFVDSQLAETDRNGRLGTFAAGLANWATDETQHADAPRHRAVRRHPPRRPPAALRRRDLRDPRRARSAPSQRGRAGLRQAQGRALRHLLRATSTTPTSARPRARCWPRTASRPRSSIPPAAACRKLEQGDIEARRRGGATGDRRRCCRGSTRATTSSR